MTDILQFIGWVAIWMFAMVSLVIVGSCIASAYFREKRKFLESLSSEVSDLAMLEKPKRTIN